MVRGLKSGCSWSIRVQNLDVGCEGENETRMVPGLGFEINEEWMLRKGHHYLGH